MNIPTNVRYDGDIGEVRRSFEAWHCDKFKCKHSTGAPTRDMHNGVYAENYGPEHQQQMWEAWQAGYRREPALPELTGDLRGILGRPNFTCNGIAQALRQMGFDIPKKSEEEQAATIYWMLGHYLRDPINWRDTASAELKASTPEPSAQQ